MKCDKHGISTDCPECVHSDLWESFNRDITKLTKERDQLQARVAELEEALRWVVSDGVIDAPLPEILNRQPAQSLVAIEARVLREYGKKYQQYRMDGGVKACGGWMQSEADRIEAGEIQDYGSIERKNACAAFVKEGRIEKEEKV